jgi:hypothetical protein
MREIKLKKDLRLFRIKLNNLNGVSLNYSAIQTIWAKKAAFLSLYLVEEKGNKLIT